VASRRSPRQIRRIFDWTLSVALLGRPVSVAGRLDGGEVHLMKDPEAEYDLEGVRRSPLPWLVAVLVSSAATTGLFVEMSRAKDATAAAAVAARDTEAAQARVKELEATNHSLESTVLALQDQQRRIAAAAAPAPQPTKARPMKRALKKRTKRR
jgi:hypothetical protein